MKGPRRLPACGGEFLGRGAQNKHAGTLRPSVNALPLAAAEGVPQIEPSTAAAQRRGGALQARPQ